MRDLTGQFGLTAIDGDVGWWIGLGELLVGDASRFSHAFIVADGGQVVEAMPGGAILTPLDYYLEGPKAAVTVFSDLALTDIQRAVIVKEARALGPDPATGRPGVGYSPFDYAAIGLDHLGFRPKWLRRSIASSGHMICSQLVDAVLLKAGVHLFADGRDPGDVTPGDLADFLVRSGREL